MSSATDLAWFARHEIRLAWREWLAMMTGGRRGRKRAALIGLIAFAAIMHLPAYVVIGRFADLEMPLDKSSLIVMTATIALAWALMLSQAIESVTRVFYARADLDLIMSSPVRLSNVFSVRIAAIALSVTAMALLLSTPFVDVLVIGGGIRWFSTFGVVIAIGLSAAAMAIAVTLLLFRLIGPSRTRLVARGGSRQQALRRKEFVLLRRDPWLLSQSLMQLLYLVPPALLLWRSFSDSSAAIVLVTPVIVMAAGQLARRAGMADDFRRRRRRPDRDRADVAVARHPRQDRGSADRDRRHFRAVGRSTRLCLAAASRDHRARRCRRNSVGYRHPALVPRAGEAQPVPSPSDLVAPGDVCGSLFLDRMGRHRGTGAGDAGCRPDQRPDDGSHHGCHLENQPAAGLAQNIEPVGRQRRY